MLRRVVVAASAAALVPVGAAGASIKVAADADRPALRVDARGLAPGKRLQREIVRGVFGMIKKRP